jgi:hypothetical protein
LIDAVMFPSDVNEVFLLIDHISGRSTKSLKDLDTEGVALPSARDAEQPPPAPTKPSVADVLDALCQIGYPPNPDPMTKAHKASFIMLLKDRLNALAGPARGVTIAYTAMFISATDGLWFPLVSVRIRRARPSAGQILRSDLARTAYPGLEPHAKRFAAVFGCFPWLMLLVLILTASAYWDVGFALTVVQRIEQLDKQRADLVRPDRQAGPGVMPLDPACRWNSGLTPEQTSECDKLIDLESQLRDSRKDLYNFANSAVGSWKDSAPHALFDLVRPIHYGFWFNGQAPNPGRPETSVAWVLSLFSTYVLPACFGFLGTLAAITRAIQGKVRDSLLEPRDLPLSVLGLAMGPIAGLAVGLYYTPSGASVAGTAGLAGAVSLSASGLGFLAGYGADAFFKFVDALLIRVFALEQSAK